MSDPQDNPNEEQEASPGVEDVGNGNEAITPAPDDAPPVRRRRGRPPKNPDAGAQKETPTGSAPKRGRPAKANRKTYTPADIEVMGRQLVGIHKMIVMVTGIPELMIEDTEGQMLAAGIIGVADQYDLELDGKTGAALQLLATAAMIYGPRALVIRAKAQQARAANTVAQGNG